MSSVTFLSSPEPPQNPALSYLWWKDVAIIDNEHYNTLDWRGKEKYLKELTALNF